MTAWLILVLALLCLTLGFVLGFVAAIVRRALKVSRSPCGYCRGHGYFGSASEAAAVDDATLRQSRSFGG